MINLSPHRVVPKSDHVPLFLNETVRSLIDVDLAMEAVQQAFISYGHARKVLSDPPALLLPNRKPTQAAFKVKGGRVASFGVAGFRMIADKETEEGEQTIDYCWVAEESTGRLIGLVDETSLHRLRTAVTGVVAAKWLARPESRVAVIIGAGRIAEEVPEPLCRAFDLQEIRVVARRPESAQAFAERHASLVSIKPFTNAHEAAEGADIVFCISSSSTTVLQAADLAPGMFVCGMGGGAEIAVDALERADRFIVDDLEYAYSIGSVRGWVEQGLDRAAISRRMDADIGEIAIKAKQGRIRNTDIVLAIVQGMAICDIALAYHVLTRAGLIEPKHNAP